MTVVQPSISAIVPARNEEATIAKCVESLGAQPEIAEIIVVNDQSTDRTAEILSDLKSQISNLKVLDTASAPPECWTGKNWAISQGAKISKGEWLLFTDADVMLLPRAAARALADAKSHDAALVSYSPEQEMRSWWERIVIPFIYCRLAAHFSYSRINDASLPDAAANGQFLMTSREAYDAAGGHAAVGGEIVEDVALAQRVKQSGRRIYFAPGQGIVRTRMYRSFAAMWEGWRKNLYLLMGHSTQAVFRELLVVVPWIPLLLLAFGFIHKLLPLFGLLLLVGRHVGYALELRRNRFPLAGILYYSVGVLYFAVVLLASAWSYRRGRVSWKGREYSTGTG
jgi:glycosyltransferase involved in cell wall biosynthesis